MGIDDDGGPRLPSVTVVMPTYNRSGTLNTVVSALLDDDALTELIIVDDGSTDATAEVAVSLASADPRVRSLHVANGGQLLAIEAGLAISRSEVVLCLDDDVLAGPGLVSGHARHHAAAQSQAVVGYMPVRLPATRSRGDWTTRLYAREYEGTCEAWDRDPDLVLRRMWFGNVSLRADDWRRVGLRLAKRNDYHDDQAFGMRAARLGLRGVFDRALRAEHLHGRSFEAFLRDARKSGAGRWWVSHLFPELAEPSTNGWGASDLRGGAAAIVGAAQRPYLRRVIVPALSAAAKAGDAAGIDRAADLAGRLLRCIEQQAGWRAAEAEGTATVARVQAEAEGTATVARAGAEADGDD